MSNQFKENEINRFTRHLQSLQKPCKKSIVIDFVKQQKEQLNSFFFITEDAFLLDLIHPLKETLSFRSIKFLHLLWPSSGCSIEIDGLISFIFLICEQLKAEPEVRYIAVEIAGRYYRKFLIECQNQLNNQLVGQDQMRSKLKKALAKKVVDQVPLHLFSCIALAMKFHQKHCSMQNLNHLFTSSPTHSYSLATFCKSQERILKTLNYNVYAPPRLLQCLELILCKIMQATNCSLPPMYPLLYDVIDVVYLYLPFINFPLGETYAGKRISTFTVAVGIFSTVVYFTNLDNEEEIIRMTAAWCEEPLSLVYKVLHTMIHFFENAHKEFLTNNENE